MWPVLVAALVLMLVLTRTPDRIRRQCAALRATREAIERAVDAVHEPMGLIDTHSKLHKAREQKRLRVLAFANMLDMLGKMLSVRRVARRAVARIISQNNSFEEYNFDEITQWQSHVAKEPLVHDYLPVLRKIQAPRDEAAWLPGYDAHLAARKLGGSFALMHIADSGAVTMPHTDEDLNDTPTGSVLALKSGEQLVVAWHKNDLSIDKLRHGTPHDDGECFADWPHLLATVNSLTIIQMKAGDAVEIDEDGVHMIVTTQSKRQISLSTYKPV